MNLVTLPLARVFIGTHMRDVAAAEEELEGSGLDWTAVRPPYLWDGPLTGTYQVAYGTSLPRAFKISRADVAHCMRARWATARFSHPNHCRLLRSSTMSTLYVTLAVIGGVLNLGSGIGAMVRLKVILPLMDGANVPQSMLVFPIGVLKVAGGLGLLAGAAGSRWSAPRPRWAWSCSGPAPSTPVSRELLAEESSGPSPSSAWRSARSHSTWPSTSRPRRPAAFLLLAAGRRSPAS